MTTEINSNAVSAAVSVPVAVSPVVSLVTIAPHLDSASAAKRYSDLVVRIRSLAAEACAAKKELKVASLSRNAAEDLFNRLTAIPGIAPEVVTAAILAAFPPPASTSKAPKAPTVALSAECQLEILAGITREGISKADLVKKFAGRFDEGQVLMAVHAGRASGDVYLSGVTKGAKYCSK